MLAQKYIFRYLSLAFISGDSAALLLMVINDVI